MRATSLDRCQRIVQSRPGQGTLETHYQTEDGRWWVPSFFPSNNATFTGGGPDVRYLHASWRGGKICNHK